MGAPEEFPVRDDKPKRPDRPRGPGGGPPGRPPFKSGKPAGRPGGGPGARPPYKSSGPRMAKPAPVRTYKGPAKLELDLAAAAQDASLLHTFLDAQADRRWERI